MLDYFDSLFASHDPALVLLAIGFNLGCGFQLAVILSGLAGSISEAICRRFKCKR